MGKSRPITEANRHYGFRCFQNTFGGLLKQFVARSLHAYKISFDELPFTYKLNILLAKHFTSCTILLGNPKTVNQQNRQA